MARWFGSASNGRPDAGASVVADDDHPSTEDVASSERFLDSIIENLPTMLFVKDAEELRFVRFNRAGEELLGYSRAELIGKNDYDLFPAEQADFFTSKDREVLEGRTAVLIPEERVGTRHNGTRTLRTRKIPILDGNGEPRYLLGISEDITEQQESEDALRVREETIRAMVSASPDIISIVDPDGRVRYTSGAVHDVLGYDPEFFEGTSPNELRLVHPDDLAMIDQAMEEAMRSPGVSPRRLRLRYRHAHGHWVVLESSARFITDVDGNITAIVVVSRDVSAQVELEEELRAAKDEAERANSAKSDFLSRMSHELRTPLNAVLGFSQLLEMDGLGEEQQEYTQQILKAGHHLLALIDEVLDIARIEAGRLTISSEPVFVDDVFNEVAAMLRPLAIEGGLNLEIEAEPLRVHVMADRQRMKQVLLNLLSNAVKYNREDGSIRLTCTRRNASVEICVADTGLGIPADKMERLFAPFDRLGADQTGVEGTGLGLALSQRLVELMGGKLTASSEVGVGSRFSIVLPYAEGPLDHMDVALEQLDWISDEDAPHTLLYIEDNLSNLKLIEGVLAHRPGTRVVPAMQGRLGLDLARQHKPDLILLDLHLPDMPGDLLLRHLRQDPSTRDIPIVVISADATKGRIRDIRAAGADGYLTKPLDVRKFLSVVDEALSNGDA